MSSKINVKVVASLVAATVVLAFVPAAIATGSGSAPAAPTGLKTFLRTPREQRRGDGRARRSRRTRARRRSHGRRSAARTDTNSSCRRAAASRHGTPCCGRRNRRRPRRPCRSRCRGSPARAPVSIGTSAPSARRGVSQWSEPSAFNMRWTVHSASNSRRGEGYVRWTTGRRRDRLPGVVRELGSETRARSSARSRTSPTSASTTSDRSAVERRPLACSGRASCVRDSAERASGRLVRAVEPRRSRRETTSTRSTTRRQPCRRQQRSPMRFQARQRRGSTGWCRRSPWRATRPRWNGCTAPTSSRTATASTGSSSGIRSPARRTRRVRTGIPPDCGDGKHVTADNELVTPTETPAAAPAPASVTPAQPTSTSTPPTTAAPAASTAGARAKIDLWDVHGRYYVVAVPIDVRLTLAKDPNGEGRETDGRSSRSRTGAGCVFPGQVLDVREGESDARPPARGDPDGYGSFTERTPSLGGQDCTEVLRLPARHVGACERRSEVRSSVESDQLPVACQRVTQHARRHPRYSRSSRARGGIACAGSTTHCPATSS